MDFISKLPKDLGTTRVKRSEKKCGFEQRTRQYMNVMTSVMSKSPLKPGRREL